MLDNYLLDNCTLQSVKGFNDYNEAIYDNKLIKCRIINSFKQITNEKGNILISSGIIQCIDPIKVGDLVDGREIVSVTCMTSFNGVIGYKGYLQ